MLDGTPVLDIKPYIPQYDNPFNLGHDCSANNLYDDVVELHDCIDIPREAPDGEECSTLDASTKIANRAVHLKEQVRWISYQPRTIKSYFCYVCIVALVKCYVHIKFSVELETSMSLPPCRFVSNKDAKTLPTTVAQHSTHICIKNKVCR